MLIGPERNFSSTRRVAMDGVEIGISLRPGVVKIVASHGGMAGLRIPQPAGPIMFSCPKKWR
jgi:hypothetical protein